MSSKEYFPTLIYYQELEQGGPGDFNAELLNECKYYMDLDEAGHDWSEENYVGGYTSYSTISNLNEISASFGELESKIRTHLNEYLNALCFDLKLEDLKMSDCWFNVMPAGVAHGLHLHPHSVISGTYYVQTPMGSSGIKFEDPRLSKFMLAPSRKKDCPVKMKNFVSIPAKAGNLVLFESWLRHEVPAAEIEGERISVSFNFA
ncbi:MAG: TIGR02466 family protein [Bdellovibrionota bacterium]